MPKPRGNHRPEERRLADQTGAKIAVIGTMANAFPGCDTFEKISEHNLKALLAAMGKGPS